MQVDSIADDLQTHQTEIEKKTKDLEKQATSWKDIESHVKKVETWLTEEAPSSMELLKFSSLPTDERVKKSKQLQKQLTNHGFTIEKLNQDLDSLIGN